MAGPLIKIIDSKKSMFDYVPGCLQMKLILLLEV